MKDKIWLTENVIDDGVRLFKWLWSQAIVFALGFATAVIHTTLPATDETTTIEVLTGNLCTETGYSTGYVSIPATGATGNVN